MQKKPRTEKILFVITLILGLSVIMGSIITGCYYIRLEDGCNENCKQCIPIITFVIALLVVLILYATQHGRSDNPIFRNLQKRFGDINVGVGFICCVLCIYFFAAFSRMLMPDSIIPELLFLILFICFVTFIFIHINYLEKIKKIIKYETAKILNIHKEGMINKQKQELEGTQEMSKEKLKKKTLIEKILFAFAIILGLSAILISIASGCYFVQPVEMYNENCKYRVSIIFIVSVLFMVSIIYATHNGRDDSIPLQERCGENNALIVGVCFIACGFFSAEVLQVLMQDWSIHGLVILVFVISLAIFAFMPISWLKKIKKIIWNPNESHNFRYNNQQL